MVPANVIIRVVVQSLLRCGLPAVLTDACSPSAESSRKFRHHVVVTGEVGPEKTAAVGTHARIQLSPQPLFEFVVSPECITYCEEN